MKPIRNFIPCAKCGDPEIPKFVRKRNRKGKTRISISGICILCRREDAAITNRKCYSEKKQDYHRRSMEWRERNRDEYNASQRDWYAKNKEGICARIRERYVPKPTQRKGWKGQRVAQPKSPWRNFDFKNRSLERTAA